MLQFHAGPEEPWKLSEHSRGDPVSSRLQSPLQPAQTEIGG
jgi:hypothetical protein